MRLTPRLLATTVLSLAVVATALAQAPSSPSAAIPLAKYIPKGDLFAYIEFQGIDAHADAWKATAASKVLNDTTTGAMLEDILSQMFSAQVAKLAPPGATIDKQYGVSLIKHLARSGFVLGLSKNAKSKNGMTGTVVVRGALRPDSKALFAQFIRGISATGVKNEKLAKPGNRDVIAIMKADMTLQGYWWVENKEDLVIADDADAVIAALDGKSPSAADLPARNDLLKAEGGLDPLGAAWLDVEGLPAVPPIVTDSLKKFGLDGVKRVEYRVGTRGKAIEDELRLTTATPRAGALALFDQPKFDVKSLPPMPEGVVEFAASSIDLSKTYAKIVEMATALKPDLGMKIEEFEATLKTKSRLRLKEDVLGRLGPKMVIYAVPGKASKSGGLFGGLASVGMQVPKAAMLIEIKDAKATTTMVDQLMIFANREMKTRLAPPASTEGDAAPGGRNAAMRKGGAPAKGTTTAAVPEFKVMTNTPKVYALRLPTAYSAMTNLQLTVVVGKKHLVIATATDAAKDALAAEAKASSKGLSAEAAKAVEGMPANPILLDVSDPRDRIPEALAKLPETLSALLAPPPPPVAPPASGGDPAAARSPGRSGRPGAGQAPSPPPGQTPAADPATPAPAAVTISVDAAKVPKPETVRPLLFPGSSAVVVDEGSIRFVSRYAFPDFPSLLQAVVRGRGAAAMFQGGSFPGMASPPSASGATGAPPAR